MAIERLLEQLENNLRDKHEVADYIDAAKTARAYLENNGCEEVVKALNTQTYRSGVIRVKDFKNAKVIPDEKFLNFYKEEHLIESCGVGYAIESRRWDALRKKLKQKSWVSGVANQASTFFGYANKKLPLNKVGLVLFKNCLDIEKTLEHEFLHIDLDVYSKNYTCFSSKMANAGIEEIYYASEMSMLDEISAYRNDLKNDKNGIKTDLREDYWIEDVNFAAENSHLFNVKFLKEALQPIKEKISPATDATIFLMKELSNRLLTPILFSLCCSLKDVKTKKQQSCLDDIILWMEAVKRKQVSKKDIYSILKKKGYCD